MLDRDEVLKKAYHDCMSEMYAKSQPEADYDNLVEEYKSGKIKKDETVYNRHYLSKEEFKYILQKYKNAYNIKQTWKPNIEWLEELLKGGGLKDKYEPSYTDEDGDYHPGHRSAENVPSLKKLINDYVSLNLNGLKDITEIDIAKDITDIVMSTIKDYKDFYRFDREEEQFDVSIYLGASPTSNPETVKKWWKENHDKDIEIEERNPELFWYKDNGYTDDDLAEEFNDPNWKENLDKEWKEKKEKNA